MLKASVIFQTAPGMRPGLCYRRDAVRGSVTTAGARLLIAVVAGLLALATPALTWAASPGDVRAQADVLRARQAATVGAEQVALLDLYALETSLGRARGDLAALRARIEKLQREQDETMHRLTIARRVVAKTELALGQELRLLYERGEPNTIAVLLGADSLDAAIAELDSIDQTARDHLRIIDQTRRARSQASALRRDLARRHASLRATEQSLAGAVTRLEQSSTARAAFLARLRSQRHLATARIAGLEAQAAAAEAKSRRLAEQARERAAAAAATAAAAKAKAPARAQPATATAPTKPGPAVGLVTLPVAEAPAGASLPLDGASAAADAGQRTLTVTATAYTVRGRTATGLPTSWGIVAVDPNVIPLGTKLTIPGYGEAIAADTGPGVQGAAIDVWVPDSAAAAAFGRRTVTIVLH